MFKNIRREYFVIYFCSTVIYIAISVMFHTIDRTQKDLPYYYDIWSSTKLSFFIYVLLAATVLAIIGITNSVERLTKRR